MDYEQKYKNALERAKYWEKNPTVWSSDDICQKIFPELKVSEDEVIRKEVLELVAKHCGKTCEMYRWLERQGDYNRLVEEMKERKELLSKEKEKAISTNDKLSLGGRIAILEELLAFTKEKQSEQKPADSYCQNNCKGFQETGKCYADGECKAKIDEKHKVGEYFTGLIPCWVNAPSTQQPAHKYHGKNIIAIHLKDGGYRCCCIDDEKPVTFTLAENTQLVEGWKRKSATWSEEDERMLGKCIDAASGYYSPEDKQGMKDWLESIKNRVQPHWKPTEEQIEVVKRAAKDIFEFSSKNKDLRLKNETYFKSLYSLYEQLNKL